VKKNDNITKDPAAAGRKGGKKGSKRLKTKLKEAGKWEDVEGLFEKIVVESMNSKSPSVRRRAAKDFGEFIKPKKREQSGNVKYTFEDFLRENTQKKNKK
jgi:hypothetical protein